MIVEIKVPSPGESITEVEIESWLVESGAYVDMDDELAEINSDKATLTVNAEQGGTIEILAAEGDTVAVGQVIAKIDTEGAAAAKTAAPAKEETSEKKEAPVAPPVADSSAKGHPSVSAAKMMKEKGIDPASVQGNGRGGRITKTDVVNHKDTAAKETPAPEKKEKKEERPLPGLPVLSVGGERTERREKMSSLRRKIAERLVSVKNETAMLTTFNEVDLQAVMDIRKKYKEKFKETHGVGLGYMSFFTKAVTMALKEFPGVNAQIDGKEIIYYDYADISIAVSSPKGLVVPVIRNAHLMSLAELEQSVLHYALKARAGKLTIDEMTGGTFSITNGGIFGSMLSTPIINPPQSAILGMHNIVQRPVAINGEVKIRPIMYLALSYDHRIVDGKGAVSFLYRIKERLEDPSRLLLEV
ncbi:MAG: 2-oxoglutarate dehydrogenase complex dihydrolipoyllysine-residue succinyltransferase [Bacteroidia bacterium]|nr:2-oxoglutarate dehydrogenase complex dihydrolipoyllysine-residue succinyltransferase [Bacteroidia bacterium]